MDENEYQTAKSEVLYFDPSDKFYSQEYFEHVRRDILAENTKNILRLNAIYGQMLAEVNARESSFNEQLNAVSLDHLVQTSKGFNQMTENDQQLSVCNGSETFCQRNRDTNATEALRTADPKLQVIKFKENFIGNASIRFCPNNEPPNFGSIIGYLEFP